MHANINHAHIPLPPTRLIKDTPLLKFKKYSGVFKYCI